MTTSTGSSVPSRETYPRDSLSTTPAPSLKKSMARTSFPTPPMTTIRNHFKRGNLIETIDKTIISNRSRELETTAESATITTTMPTISICKVTPAATKRAATVSQQADTRGQAPRLHSTTISTAEARTAAQLKTSEILVSSK